MSEKNCVFCKISRGEFDAAKVWENDEFFAFLDLFPNTRGMTLVVTKEHYGSYVSDMPDDVYKRFMLAAKEVTKLLDSKLRIKRTAMVTEGLGVDHAHIKLYPMYGLGEKFEAIIPKETAYYERYLGFLTTLQGPKADFNGLKKLAKEIRES